MPLLESSDIRLGSNFQILNIVDVNCQPGYVKVDGVCQIEVWRLWLLLLSLHKCKRNVCETISLKTGQSGGRLQHDDQQTININCLFT
ncbi:hypothetical protein HHI36_011556 [Cryptolaemus montrouzieri]|uniref:Uncharacterized protein n=1 Tax=Cryptolaemus montrouzieri TaxID=559131 RepID=A0ABD2MM08_9CUCU